MLDLGPICPHCDLVVGASADELRNPPPYPRPILCPHCQQVFESDPDEDARLEAFVSWLQNDQKDDRPSREVLVMLPKLLLAAYRTRLETRRSEAWSPAFAPEETFSIGAEEDDLDTRVPDGWGEDGPSFDFDP